MIFSLIGLCALFSLLCAFLFYHIKAVILRRPPFVTTKQEGVNLAIAALNLDNGSVLYDLGCGDGRILETAMKQTNCSKGVGIEVNIIASTIARFRTRNMNVKILSMDFNKVNLQEATHIYMYLLPATILELERKILSECRGGTIIVSYDFALSNLKLVRTIHVPGPTFGSHRLYVYKVIG
ncbi:MAG: methionine biosynthesis protein MetW [Candidatus Paceibacterota bacterium]